MAEEEVDLRSFLQAAQTSWSDKDLGAVEEKLARIGIEDVTELVAALRPGVKKRSLNKKLRDAGDKGFAPATIEALQQQATLVEASHGLRAFLRFAQPGWKTKDLDSVEEKLAKVGIVAVEDLLSTLRVGVSDSLNRRLRRVGERCFTAETLAVLQRHAALCGQEATNPDAKQAVELDPLAQEAIDLVDVEVRATSSDDFRLLLAIARHATFGELKQRLATQLERNDVLTRGRLVKQEGKGVFSSLKDGRRVESSRTVFIMGVDFASGSCNVVGASTIAGVAHGSASCHNPKAAEHDALSKKTQAPATEPRGLKLAVRSGNLQDVQALFRRRADVNAQDEFGETALMEAARQGHERVCELVMQYGGDPLQKALSGAAAKDFALAHESLRPLFRDANRWLERFWRQVVQDHDVERACGHMDTLQHGSHQFEAADERGGTLLHACAARPSVSSSASEMVHLLVDFCMQVNAENRCGETPLILAVRAVETELVDEHRLCVVFALLDRGSAVNVADACSLETPLTEAARRGDLDLVLALLDASADPARANISGKRPCELAEDPNIVQILMEAMDLPSSTGAASGTSKSSARAAGSGLHRERMAPPISDPKIVQILAEAMDLPSSTGAASGASQVSELERLAPPTSDAEDLLQRVLKRYPSFASSGVQLPSDWKSWTHQELEHFVSTFGQLLPPGRTWSVAVKVGLRVREKTTGRTGIVVELPLGPPVFRVCFDDGRQCLKELTRFETEHGGCAVTFDGEGT